jgi:hypothetical protein
MHRGAAKAELSAGDEQRLAQIRKMQLKIVGWR